jgi:hypothetical protein
MNADKDHAEKLEGLVSIPFPPPFPPLPPSLLLRLIRPISLLLLSHRLETPPDTHPKEKHACTKRFEEQKTSRLYGKNSRSIHTSPKQQQQPSLFIPYSPSSVPSVHSSLDVTDGFLSRFLCRPSLCRVSTSAASLATPTVAWMWAQTRSCRRYPVCYVCLGLRVALLGHLSPSLPPSLPLPLKAVRS